MIKIQIGIDNSNDSWYKGGIVQRLCILLFRRQTNRENTQVIQVNSMEQNVERISFDPFVLYRPTRWKENYVIMILVFEWLSPPARTTDRKSVV